MADAESTASTLAAALEGVLDGSVDLDAVLHDDAWKSAELEACYHGLMHFLVDADIRAKDANYREMQEAGMRELIRRLRCGGSAGQLAEISFLRWPDVL